MALDSMNYFSTTFFSFSYTESQALPMLTRVSIYSLTHYRPVSYSQPPICLKTSSKAYNSREVVLVLQTNKTIQHRLIVFFFFKYLLLIGGAWSIRQSEFWNYSTTFSTRSLIYIQDPSFLGFCPEWLVTLGSIFDFAWINQFQFSVNLEIDDRKKDNKSAQCKEFYLTNTFLKRKWAY